jgi:hypothetical protein
MGSPVITGYSNLLNNFVHGARGGVRNLVDVEATNPFTSMGQGPGFPESALIHEPFVPSKNHIMQDFFF